MSGVDESSKSWYNFVKVSEQEIDVSCYITPSGEDTECYMFLAIDDGPTTKDIPIQDREEFHWFSVNEVVRMPTYEDLLELWIYLPIDFTNKNI